MLIPLMKKLKSKLDGNVRPSFSIWLIHCCIRFIVVHKELESYALVFENTMVMKTVKS